jgi:hypothetical protein
MNLGASFQNSQRKKNISLGFKYTLLTLILLIIFSFQAENSAFSKFLPL